MANSYVGDPYSLIADRPVAVTAAQRHVMIAEAAYFLAQRRGFAPGGELDDWLRAEQQVDASLGTQHR
jgi:hypothetical protein